MLSLPITYHIEWGMLTKLELIAIHVHLLPLAILHLNARKQIRFREVKNLVNVRSFGP